MKTNAILLALLIFCMSLAGCISQTDGVAEVTLTDDQVDAIVDEHLEDFLANVSIVVNEEITNHYNNTNMNNDTSGNSSQLHHQYSNGTIQVITQPGQIVDFISVWSYSGQVVNTAGFMIGGYDYTEDWDSDSHSLSVNCSSFSLESNTVSGIQPSDGGLCEYTITNQWNESTQWGNWESYYQNNPNTSPPPTEPQWPLNGHISVTYIILDVE